MENPKKSDQAKNVKELIKPVDFQSEEQFFEVQSLCSEFGNGIECKGFNKGIDEEDDLLF